jgi:HK97 family phage major capsid protein
VFDLFNHERLVLGTSIIVPAQVTFGTIGALTAAGDEKPEATIDLAPVTVHIRKAAVWAAVSDETLEDFAGFSAWMHSEFTRQLLSAIDNQLLNGTGTAPQVAGLLATSGVQTQSKGADTLTVAISKAFAKVLDAGFFPTAILVSPTDFAALTAATPIQFNGTFFGVQLIASENVANNLPIVGDFSAATVFEKSGLVFEMTNADQDSFLSNISTIRAEQRLCLGVFSPPAFCAVVA